MDEKKMKQMAKMVDAVQPKCDDKILTAMTCSHAGSMTGGLFSKFFGGGGGGNTSHLPNPVFIAVGAEWVYAFDYAPRGFNFKIKKEAARWRKDQIEVIVKGTGGMATFDLVTASGDNYQLEIPTMMGGKELVEMFLNSFSES